MGKFITSLTIILIILCGLAIAKPYWNKYNVSKDVEAAAIYGTKHSIYETEIFIKKKMREAGREYKPENFLINKYDDNSVTVECTYKDHIGLFGIQVKELKFEISDHAEEIEEVL